MWSAKDATKFALVGLVFEFLLIVIFGVCFTYQNEPLTINGKQVTDGGVQYYYGMFQDVHVMIFVGFGFLMTFLSRHGFGSVGLNFMVSAYVIQWAIITNSLIERAMSGEAEFTGIPINMKSLVTADFAAAAVLISFGAVVGRISPMQLLFMAIFELIFYGVNENIGGEILGAVDCGGSMIVHAFGAYFGLAASLAMSKGKGKNFADHPLNGSSKTSDMFAMIGTLFLWIFWPSFTGVLAEDEQKYRVVVNTFLALATSCAASFSFTLLFRPEKKFNMVDIQNATLAGGVAIGSVCDLNVQPFGACIVGLVASLISVVGYVVIQPALERSLGLFDTCGVHNLHGMPGVLGGLSSIVVAYMAGDATYGSREGLVHIYELREEESAGKQAMHQGLCLVCTILIASLSGYVVGAIISLPFFSPVAKGQEYEDSHFWEVEGEGDHEPSEPALISQDE